MPLSLLRKTLASIKRPPHQRPIRRFGRWALAVCWLPTLITLRIAICQEVETVAPQPTDQKTFAYAENDYRQKIPLVSAMELGFRFVEADVFLVDNRVMVGGSVLDMQSKGSFEELYLVPLEKLARDRNDLLMKSQVPLTLVVDIKSEAEPTYLAVRQLLVKYASMLTRVVDGKLQTGPVTVVVAGNSPRERIAAENPRLAAIDGRITDLDSEAPSHLIPIISARWYSHFRWQGRSEITSPERLRLASFVSRAHAKKRLIRFWSTPDGDRSWTTLRSAEVDLIGAENYAALNEFLTPRKSPFTP